MPTKNTVCPDPVWKPRGSWARQLTSLEKCKINKTKCLLECLVQLNVIFTKINVHLNRFTGVYDAVRNTSLLECLGLGSGGVHIYIYIYTNLSLSLYIYMYMYMYNIYIYTIYIYI